MKSYFLEMLFHHNAVKKPTTIKETPNRIKINPLIVQFGLLYIKERLGPTKDLL